jgi:hypothetical protein
MSEISKKIFLKIITCIYYLSIYVPNFETIYMHDSYTYISLSVYICIPLPRWAAEASNGGGLIASPSLDDIPIHAPILEALSTLPGFAPTHSATAAV